MTKDQVPLWIALTVSIGFLSALWLLAFHEIPSTSHDLLVAMTGVLGSAFTGIINYFFGSSAGSARKTDILAEKDKNLIP